MDRITRFNNAGIQLLRLGRYDIAHDLLRASLEAKLAHDRQEMERQQNPQFEIRSVSPECVSTGEEHLSNLHVYMSQSALPRDEEEGRGERSPHLYIYNEGFIMQDGTQASIQLRSAINVFNLGLVHQLKNRREEKTRDFYKVAAILLAMVPGSPDTLILQMAVANNFGVWSHDNQDDQQALSCMRQLAVLVQCCQQHLSREVRDGLLSNVTAMGICSRQENSNK